MSKPIKTWLIALAMSLPLSLAATAKEPFDPKPESKDTITVTPDAGRLTEILIELAWLGDPLTYPYYLEAHVEGSALQVRGFVPSKAVRDQALKLARLRSPLTVKDGTTVRPGIAGPPVPIPGAQLEKAGRACLRVSLPEADSRFKVQADNAGRVRVMGRAHSFEEKLAVSQELRRLHGCTVVVNMVHVQEAGPVKGIASIPKPEEIAFIPKPRYESAAMDSKWPDKPKPGKPKPISLTAAAAPETKSKSFLEHLGFSGPKSPPTSVAKVNNRPKAPAAPANKAKENLQNHDSRVVSANYGPGAPREAKEPYVTHGTVLVKEEPLPLSPDLEMKKHIAAKCAIPEDNLQVHITSATELEVHIQANNQDEANALAQRIFQLPDLLPYRVDLKVTVPK